jgi:hypothetical protein
MRTRFAVAGLTCLAGVCATAPSALATIWTFNNILTGAQENPPVITPATGTVFGTYDDEMNMLMISLTSEGYTSNTRFAHIHEGAVGVNGPIRFNLPGTFGIQTYQFTDAMFMFTEAQEAAFLAGNFYVNVHTINNGGGELRAQLIPVPTPGTLALASLGGLIALRRRGR